MDDDYRNPGKSIAELNDLIEDDPWQKPVTNPEKHQEQLEQFQKRLSEEHFQDPAAQYSFDDPPDNEDMTITDKSILTVFWRITVPCMRLIDLVTANPSLKKLSLTMRNNSYGCWIVVTSKRIAQKISLGFHDQHISNIVETCDIKGHTLSRIENKIAIGWRPWNQVGDPSDIKPEEFFYCIADYDGRLRVHFVPEFHWNDNGTIYDGALGIEHLDRLYLTATDKPYMFIATQNMWSVKPALDRAGFRENLLFHAYVLDNKL